MDEDTDLLQNVVGKTHWIKRVAGCLTLRHGATRQAKLPPSVCPLRLNTNSTVKRSRAGINCRQPNWSKIHPDNVFFFKRENKQKEEEINPHLTLSVCFSSFLSLSVREPSFPVQGLLYTGKAWRSVNNTQPEAPLQPSNVTLHTAERRRRHRTDGNNAGVSLPACPPPCLSVCLTQSGSGFLRQ